MKRKSLLFLLTFLLSSCTTVYIPTEVNAPMFREKHRFAGSVSYGLNGINVQTDYSITKEIAVISAGSYLNKKSNDYEDFQKYAELGFGYFRADKKRSCSFEIFGGIGFGSGRSKDIKFNVIETGNFYKAFIQPDLSISIGWIDLDIALKTGLLKFTSYSIDNTTKITDPPAAFGIEPAFTFRVGSPYFKVKYQLGLSFMPELNGTKFGREVIINSIGAVIQF